MKIFWWQGGLHAQPETPEERKALAMLVDNARITSIGATPEEQGENFDKVISFASALLNESPQSQVQVSADSLSG